MLAESREHKCVIIPTGGIIGDEPVGLHHRTCKATSGPWGFVQPLPPDLKDHRKEEGLIGKQCNWVDSHSLIVRITIKLE